MTVSDADISKALLISTRDGTYPDSEEILTTDLASSALRPTLQLISEVKETIETDVRGVSQNSSSDVEDWITQARHLQEDIERSKAVAREIVKEQEEGQGLSARVQDAKAKLELLQNETSFNSSVTLSLENTWAVDKDLNEAESTLTAGRLIELPANIQQLSSRISELAESNGKEINGGRISRLQDAVVDGLTSATISMVEYQKVDGQHHVTVNQGNHTLLDVSLDRLLDALGNLDSLDGPIRILSRTFHRKICQPLLSRSSEASACSIDETSHRLTLSSGDTRKDAQNVLDCLTVVFVFLHTHFPSRLSSAIGTTLSKELIGAFIRDWLTPSIPLGLSDFRQSYNIQTAVEEFAHLTSSYDWPGHKDLKAWVEKLPSTWLEKRRTSAVDAVRKALKAQRGPNREVQRVERQNISKQDEAFAQNGVEEWNAKWTDDEPDTTAMAADNVHKVEEEMSGWNFDEDTKHSGSTAPSPSKAQEDAEDTSDTWGWDEDEADEKRPDDSKSQTGNANIEPVNDSSEHREVTLSETYMITDIPDQLFDVISGELQDAKQMKGSDFAAFESISASSGLLSLPALILAMFRATAPTYYTSTIPNGNMHLYNDCVYVVEKLRDLANSMSLNRLLADCDVLERFARSAYAREMDTQRTVLGDLLDGAQGFINCTRFPYSAECENAVSSTIDRLRAVHHEWSSILSRSALLQSTSSLLSSVIEKVVKDVEDMEDISEAESQRLTAFCGQFSTLEDLFMSERPVPVEGADTKSVPLTAVYVSNWLRFQYLSNILESSLVDIKYLWTEGELSLELTADEVVELIEALFAESSHRRNAIAEIRRSRPKHELYTM